MNAIVPAQTIAEPGLHVAPVERLQAGEVFVELCSDEVASRAAGLAAALDQMADPCRKVIWVGNPLRAPLTIERFMMQAVGPKLDPRQEYEPAEFATMLLGMVGAEERALLVVQQPETLDAEAREVLAAIAQYLATAGSPVQFLFCGTTAFQPIMRSTMLPALRPEFRLPVSTFEHTMPSELRRSRRGWIGFCLLVVAIGVLAWQQRAVWPLLPDWLRQIVGNVSTSQPASAAQPIDPAALRREFDDFLTERDPTLHLSPEQRDQLFEEFMRRRAPAERAQLAPGGDSAPAKTAP